MEKKKGKKGAKKIIIISAVCLILIVIGGYFILGSVIKRNPENRNFNSDRRGNFTQNQTPLSEETKNEITSFFGSSPSSSEIQTYCANNRSYCFYYCRETGQNNSEIDFCKQLKNLPYLNRSNKSGE
jgi:uncharacterized protein YneF (UPF0154 family)